MGLVWLKPLMAVVSDPIAMGECVTGDVDGRLCKELVLLFDIGMAFDIFDEAAQEDVDKKTLGGAPMI